MPRPYGRAPKGERGTGAVPQKYGANGTLLAALGRHGGEAVRTSEGATEAEVFRVDVEQALRPTRRPGDTVIRDHLRAHNAAGIREAMERTGARLPYLPPYSPALAPIERGWSTRQAALRAAKARTRGALEHAIAQALPTSTASEAHSWFHHWG
jgi:transposase